MKVLHSASDAARWLRAQGCTALHGDSRQVRAGEGFLAWPGARVDGRGFVPQVLAQQAAACLVEPEGAPALDWQDARLAAVPGLKALSGDIAALFYDQPSAALHMVAFTGTNGKTSSAWWLSQLLGAVKRLCAVVGTLGVGRPGTSDWGNTGLTTPDAIRLQAALRGFVDGGVQACAMEASSIGLVDGRLAGCQIQVAVLTNVTQDHLDYHGDMGRYWAAKRSLFDWTGLRAAVINIDDAKGVELACELQQRPGFDVWTVSRHDAAARLRVAEYTTTATGMRLVLAEGERRTPPLALPLVGEFNVSNVLGVVAAARALGVSLDDAAAACAALTPVPGRMQSVIVPRSDAAQTHPLVVVDYAHTPDALQQALRALVPLARSRGGRLCCVVGCGGNRDAGKRPLMAAVAEREADALCLTSDNPRHEDPQTILAHMVAGLAQPQAVRVEPDRARAIAMAVSTAAAADVVLIAGKGHEDYQDVAGQKLPFSDLAHATAALKVWEAHA